MKLKLKKQNDRYGFPNKEVEQAFFEYLLPQLYYKRLDGIACREYL